MAPRISAERIPLIALSPPMLLAPRVRPSGLSVALERLEDAGILVLVVLAVPLVMLALGLPIALLIKAVAGLFGLFG
jgi:hypothetical protein